MRSHNRIIACLLSAITAANSVLLGGIGTVVACDGPYCKAEEIPYAIVNDEITEGESVHENSNIAENKLIFSVLDFRTDDEDIVYLDDNSTLCKSNELTQVSMVYETQKEQNKNGSVYEVFYEAIITSSDVWNVANRLEENAEIVSAEPDFIWENTAEENVYVVTDAEYAETAHFDVLDARGVWDSLTNASVAGNGVVVAVIDTGVDYTHSDLADNIWVNSGEIAGNGIDDDENGYVDDVHGIDLIEGDGDPMDDHGHGTHVAGIIAMTPGNGGGVGLAYGADVMCIKAGEADGDFSSSDIARAVKYAVDNGADVINMSFGGEGKSAVVEAALKDAFDTCVLVASAGNDELPTSEYPGGIDIYPAGYSYVIGVMAADENNSLAYFSNYDYMVGQNCEYEMAAPGVNIYSTLPENRHALWSGTSMAAPLVSAAAAIIRSEYTNKGKYSSRFIMGQLVNGTQERMEFTSKTNEFYSYPHLNVLDSLKYKPKPLLNVEDVYILDSESVSTENNSDGIVQSGETINLGLSIWNSSGVASELTVKVEAVSSDGQTSPYIEFITDIVQLEDVGIYEAVTNGMMFADDNPTDVSDPLQFRIKEDAPNNADILLKFTITAKNGMDDTDTELYSFQTTYTLEVRNEQIVSGIINEDMTWTSDRYWIVKDKTLISEGVTVTVEAGTQIQFWSAESEDIYSGESNACLDVDGSFICQGTEENPVEIFPAKGFEASSCRIEGCWSYFTMKEDTSLTTLPSFDPSKGYTELNYTNVMNPALFVTRIDHCLLEGVPNCGQEGCESECEHTAEIVIYAQRIENTIFKDLQPKVCGFLETRVVAYDIENCLFDNCVNYPDISILTAALGDVTEDGSSEHMTGSGMRNCVSLLCNEYYDLYSQYEYSNNAYLKDLYHFTSLDEIQIASTLYASEGENAPWCGHFWGTEDIDLMKLMMKYGGYGSYDKPYAQTPYLTLESPELESIYPFVTEVYITDTDGNIIESTLGGQTVEIHVKFNRDMSFDVQPEVTYGPNAPYTNYFVHGNWESSREWIGTTTINPYIEMETMYVRVKDAAAAEDEWLLTGEDAGRFPFTVTSNSAQAMTLQGAGGPGVNNLSWLQDDFDTLAGYNLYRSTAYNSNISIEEQDFSRLNTSVLSMDELSYVDHDVQQGMAYYYYFTVVDTDLYESQPSNVVKCTPLDGEQPLIQHSPIANAKSNEALTIIASVTDNVIVEDVTLNYKNTSDTEWISLPMRNTSGSSYRLVISAYEVVGNSLEYYITASDGVNIAYCGTEENPNIIMIESEEVIETTTVPTDDESSETTTTTTAPTTSTETTTESNESTTTEPTDPAPTEPAEDPDLPQTGYAKRYQVIVIAALTLTMLGLFAILMSRGKKNETK